MIVNKFKVLLVFLDKEIFIDKKEEASSGYINYRKHFHNRLLACKTTN